MTIRTFDISQNNYTQLHCPLIIYRYCHKLHLCAQLTILGYEGSYGADSDITIQFVLRILMFGLIRTQQSTLLGLLQHGAKQATRQRLIREGNPTKSAGSPFQTGEMPNLQGF